MKVFYHCTCSKNVQTVLNSGIRTGKSLGVQSYFCGFPVDSSYIYLWKNLEILEGRLTNSLLTEGFDFLKVQLPEQHPIERDYDIQVLFKRDPSLFFQIINLLEIDFSPGNIIGNKRLRELASQVPPSENVSHREMTLSRLVAEEIIGSKNHLKKVLDLSTNLKWDEVVGFYRTPKDIPNHDPYDVTLYESLRTN